MNVGNARNGETHKDGSAGWHRARRKGVGGSDAAVILGMEPFGLDRKALWRRKIGREDPFQGNTATEYGSIMEDYILYRAIREGELDNDFSVFSDFEVEDPPQQLIHTSYDWCVGNVDGYIPGKGRGVEIKTSSKPFKYVDGDCKDLHYPQIQHYMAVTGLDRWSYLYFEVPFERRCALDIETEFVSEGEGERYFNYLADEGKLSHTVIDRDDAYIGNLLEVEESFWAKVKSGTEPELREPEGEVRRDEDTKLQGLFDSYARADKKIDDASAPVQDKVEMAEDQKEKYKNELRTYLDSLPEDAKKVHCGEHHATWNARGYWQITAAEPEKPSRDHSDPF